MKQDGIRKTLRLKRSNLPKFFERHCNGRDAAGCLAHLTRGERISAIVSMMGYLYSEIDPAMMNDGLEEMVEASEEFLLMIKEAASNKKGDS